MSQSELTPHQQEKLDHLIRPYLEKITALEVSHGQKDLDILILRHAFQNLSEKILEASEAVDRLKSFLIRPQTEQAGEPSQSG